MKTLIIAALALTSFSVASFAQTATPPKKNETVKTQVAKSPSDAKTKATNVFPRKSTTTTKSVETKPNGKHTAVKQQDKKPAAKAAAVAPAPAATPTGTGGNAAVHHKSNNSQAANAATGHLKKGGTPEKDVKEQKKHG